MLVSYLLSIYEVGRKIYSAGPPLDRHFGYMSLIH